MGQSQFKKSTDLKGLGPTSTKRGREHSLGFLSLGLKLTWIKLAASASVKDGG